MSAARPRDRGFFAHKTYSQPGAKSNDVKWPLAIAADERTMLGLLGWPGSERLFSYATGAGVHHTGFFGVHETSTALLSWLRRVRSVQLAR